MEASMANTWDSIIGTVAYTKNLERINSYAASKEYTLNCDTERVKKVVGLMTMNHEKHGAYYCPCKQSHPLQSTDAVCPCPEIDQDITAYGYCHCKLFYFIPR